jgi:hypothetical protein
MFDPILLDYLRVISLKWERPSSVVRRLLFEGVPN